MVAFVLALGSWRIWSKPSMSATGTRNTGIDLDPGLQLVRHRPAAPAHLFVLGTGYACTLNVALELNRREVRQLRKAFPRWGTSSEVLAKNDVSPAWPKLGTDLAMIEVAVGCLRQPHVQDRYCDVQPRVCLRTGSE
jgi:hypothetical protein